MIVSVPDIHGRKMFRRTLMNGLELLIIQEDPKQSVVNGTLGIPLNGAESPPNLGALKRFAVEALKYGSTKYPGFSGFEEFFNKYNCFYRQKIFCDGINFDFQLDRQNLREGLSRISDSLGDPLIPPNCVSHVEKELNSFWFSMLNSDTSRMDCIIQHMINHSSMSDEMYKIDTSHPNFLTRVKNYILQNLRPSKMFLVIIVNSDTAMEDIALDVKGTFGTLRDKCVTSNSVDNNVATDASYLTSLAQAFSGKRVHTLSRGSEDILRFSFRLPPPKRNDTNIFHAYHTFLLENSSPMSLTYTLKAQGLIKKLSMCFSPWYHNIRLFEVQFYLTTKGKKAIDLIANYFFGYLDLIRSVPPNVETFELLRRTYQSIVVCERPSMETQTTLYMDYILKGRPLNRFFDYLVPQEFEAQTVIEFGSYLRIDNSITIFSDTTVENVDTHKTWGFLAYSIVEAVISPNSCGLSLPSSNPLISKSFAYLTPDIPFQKAIDESKIRAFIKPDKSDPRVAIIFEVAAIQPEAYSVQLCQLYAAMIRKIVWLELWDDLCIDFFVEAVTDALQFKILCLPDVLPAILDIVLGLIQNPISLDYISMFNELKAEHLEALETTENREPQHQFSIQAEELLVKGGFSLTEHKNACKIVLFERLFTKFDGSLNVLMVGNLDSNLFCGVIDQLRVLTYDLKEMKPPCIMNPLDPNFFELELEPIRQFCKFVKLKDNFEGNALYIAYYFGTFEYKQWAILLVLSTLVSDVLENQFRSRNIFGLCVDSAALRKRNDLWLSIKIVGHGRLEYSEDSIKSFLGEGLNQELLYMRGSDLRSRGNSAVFKNFEYAETLSERVDLLWLPISLNPYKCDLEFRKNMVNKVIGLKVQDVHREFGYRFFKNPITRTVCFIKSDEEQSTL